METKIFNDDNLLDSDIDETVIRVKVYIMNDSNDIFLASSNGGLQLPGGHVEEGETLVSTVKREVQEETGIILDDSEISEPFFEVKHYTKNHKNTNRNRLSIIHYYLVKTNKNINLYNTHLTDNEKEYNFKIIRVNLKDFSTTINHIIQTSAQEINRVIAMEMLESFQYLEKYLINTNK